MLDTRPNIVTLAIALSANTKEKMHADAGVTCMTADQGYSVAATFYDRYRDQGTYERLVKTCEAALAGMTAVTPPQLASAR